MAETLDTAPVTPAVDDLQDSLSKVLASPAFRLAEREASLLRYLIGKTIAGEAESLKEYTIALDVFHRPETFDPRKDSIVRVEARSLRLRLARYYEAEGASDKIRIELRKGTYRPRFLTIPSAVPATEIAEEAVTPDFARHSPRFPLRPFSVVAIVGLVAILLFTIPRIRQHTGDYGHSVAVLPFQNLSDPAGENELFSDGLTDELIDSLGRVPGLNVVARSSAFQFKGKSVDVRGIGKQLNVRTVLEGSVRRYGDRLRVTAQLDNTADGYRIWSASYDREVGDALAVQREISAAITGALGLALNSTTARTAAFHAATQSGSPQSDSAENTSPEVYRLYLTGRYYENRGISGELNSAVSFYTQATTKDPNYAPAWAALARCYTRMASVTSATSKEMKSQIRTAAQRALELNAGENEAHLAMASVEMMDRDWPQAEKELRRALELKPGDAESHRTMGTFLQKVGRPEEALVEHRRALELDPLSAVEIRGVARSLYYLHRFDEAIETYRQALALEPNSGMSHQGLGLAYIQSGKFEQGIAETEIAQNLMGGDPICPAQLGYALALSGQTARVRTMLTALVSSRQPVKALSVAYLYLGLRDRDHTFEWLGKAVAQDDLNLYLKTDPIYDPIRGDGRFVNLLHSLGQI